MPRLVTFEVPDEIVDLCGSTEALARRARELMVLDALRERQISTGKAAALLGTSVWEVHELADRRQVPMVEMTGDELADELHAADEVFDRGGK